MATSSSGSLPSASVTASCGVAELTASGSSTPPQELLALADQALYRAKSHGRNRVEPATPTAGD